MKLFERFRNYVECSPAANRLYSAVGRSSVYRKLIMSQARRRIEDVKNNKGYSILLETSGVCNARCSFCVYQDMKRKKMIMPDDIFNIVLERILKENINPLFFDLFGCGEPLIDPDIVNRIRRVKKSFPASVVRTFTNFNLADDAIIDDLLTSGLDSLSISVNATEPESYKKIMQLDYSRLIRNIERLLERRKKLNPSISISVSMVLSKDNLGQYKEFIRQWGDRVNNVYTRRAHDWGGALDAENQYLEEQALYPCIDLFERIVILSNGDYALCCADYEGATKKNVISDGILDAFHSKPFTDLRTEHLQNDIKKVHMCANCFMTHNDGKIWMLRNFLPRYTI